MPWHMRSVFKLEHGKNRYNPITDSMVEQAKDNLIISREIHLDQLAINSRKSGYDR